MTQAIHIYRVPSASYKQDSHCPTCGSMQPFCVTLLGGYCGGVNLTCTTCGESWSDGERNDRPFERFWRRDSIARALKKLETAVTHEEAIEMTRYDIGESK